VRHYRKELAEGECPDTGNHDDLSQLWAITKTEANLNPTWLGTQTAGSCAIQAWFFGIDSGVDSDHPDLNVIEAVDFINDGSGPEDGHGHGTHTAGTATAIDGNGGVVGMAPGAPVFGFKVCGNDGSCSLSAILAAIDEVSARKSANPGQPMVANMSLGGDPSPTMEEAVRNSVNNGVVYAIGAGNGLIGACIFPVDAAGFSPANVGDDDITASGGSNGDTKPINGAITVTSSDQNDSDVNCNYGAPVTVAAPGVGILSTDKNGGYKTLNGTSMATPHVAGAALLYLQSHPAATPEEVEAAIVGYLDSWTTNEQPNASGRLNAGNL
jgi:subtilisin family serine protease